MNQKYLGSNSDDFLQEQYDLEIKTSLEALC